MNKHVPSTNPGSRTQEAPRDKNKSWRRDVGKQEQKQSGFKERPGFYKGARIK